MSQALQTLSGNSKHISLFGVRGAFYLSTCRGFRLVAKIRVEFLFTSSQVLFGCARRVKAPIHSLKEV